MIGSRMEEVLTYILGKGELTSKLFGRIERLLLTIHEGGEWEEETHSRVEDILVAILNGERYEEETHSRIEEILKAKANGEPFEHQEYADLSRIEALLLEWLEDAVIYAFHIDPNKSDPDSAVTYLEDAVGMTPAKMTADGYDYGSWAGAFFMPKPCMLKFDGTVDYYLDPDDYSKKADGTPSDYNNLAYEGNVMLEFPKIWYKFVAGEEAGEGYFYVSNRKIDDTYHCWCNYDSLNNEIDHFYMAAYNGCIYDGKLRSISGLKLTPWSTTAYSASSAYAVGAKVHYEDRMYQCVTAVTEAEPFDPEKWEQFAYNGQTTGTQEVDAALAVNTKSSPEWYIDVLADRQLITGLLTLTSKSLDSQGKLGRGIDSGNQAAKEAYITGSLDDKGLFYGSTTNGSTAVKTFGMENFWACCWHRTAGLVGASNGFRYKLTYGTADGSEATSYNSNGASYNLLVSAKPGTNYVSKMVYGDHGFMPLSTSGGSASKYYCDYYYGGNGFALFGGSSYAGAYDGVWYFNLNDAFGHRYWHVTASPSCKPLAELPTFTDTNTVIDYE